MSEAATTEKTRAEKALEHVAALDKGRTGWDALWQELADVVHPRRNLVTRSTTPESAPDREKVAESFDGTAMRANRTLARGQFSRITPMGARWFALQPPAELADQPAAVRWYQRCGEILQSRLNASNFYSRAIEHFLDRGAFGTAATEITGGKNGRGLHFRAFEIGSYSIANDAMDEVDTLARTAHMTPGQIIDLWPETAPDTVRKKLSEPKERDTRLEVVHLIRPRRDRDPRRSDAENKPFESPPHPQEGEGHPLRERIRRVPRRRLPLGDVGRIPLRLGPELPRAPGGHPGEFPRTDARHPRGGRRLPPRPLPLEHQGRRRFRRPRPHLLRPRQRLQARGMAHRRSLRHRQGPLLRQAPRHRGGLLRPALQRHQPARQGRHRHRGPRARQRVPRTLPPHLRQPHPRVPRPHPPSRLRHPSPPGRASPAAVRRAETGRTRRVHRRPRGRVQERHGAGPRTEPARQLRRLRRDARHHRPGEPREAFDFINYDKVGPAFFRYKGLPADFVLPPEAIAQRRQQRAQAQQATAMKEAAQGVGALGGPEQARKLIESLPQQGG